jgi:hypothetical protein
MSDQYTIQQGDHISSVAADYGLPRNRIWNDPANSELKSRRDNPNVLLPGDQVFIPDLNPPDYSRPTDATHKFVINREPLEVRMVLCDQYEKPIANAKCDLRMRGALVKVTTDSQGKFQQKLTPDIKEIQLTIHGDQTPYAEIALPIKIGFMDPVDALTGQQARLNNLGYAAGTVGGTDKATFESAVEEFQCDSGLTIDGICGPQTQAKLKQVHGC